MVRRALQPPARRARSPVLAWLLDKSLARQDTRLALPGSWGSPAAETASLSPPRRWLPGGWSSVFAPPQCLIGNLYPCLLGPSGHWRLGPGSPRTRYAPVAGARGAGSAHTGSGATGASLPSQSTSRPCSQRPVMEASDGTEETPPPLTLTRFQLSEEYGFLLPDPLVGDGCAASACYKSQRTEK